MSKPQPKRNLTAADVIRAEAEDGWVVTEFYSTTGERFIQRTNLITGVEELRRVY